MQLRNLLHLLLPIQSIQLQLSFHYWYGTHTQYLRLVGLVWLYNEPYYT